MISKKLLSLLLLCSVSEFYSQTDLVRKENKTITKTDLLKIRNVTDFFPMLGDSINFLEGTLICKTGGESFTETCKTTVLTPRQKELLKYSDVNSKIYADIKYIDQSDTLKKLIRSATLASKFLSKQGRL